MLESTRSTPSFPRGLRGHPRGEAQGARGAAEPCASRRRTWLRLGVIEGIVPEPTGGAHRNWEETAENLRGPLRDALWRLRSLTPEQLVSDRYEKFRKIGVFEESA